ncbi:MAG: barstar family protein [Ginsengibacter sp.]
MSAISKISQSYFTENNIRYVFIDGNTCTNIEQCYKTLQQQLSIPDYFGHNLDALEEVLGDLDWVVESTIKIILLNSDAFLSEDKKKKTVFLDILNSVKNEKMEIIYLD